MALATFARAMDPPTRLAGLSLAEALLRLEAETDLEIVFSEELVRSEMTVTVEPTASEPRAILAEILAPHGLTTRAAAGNRLVVVRRPVEPGALAGLVRERLSLEPLPGARVTLPGTGRETGTDDAGRFRFEQLAPGFYAVRATVPGVDERTLPEVRVAAGETRTVVLELSIVTREEIVITPRLTRVSRDEPVSALGLEADQVENLPVAAADPFRAAALLPGVSGHDFSARFSLHGGRPDEVLVLLDGVELFEPYHLKDLESAFSIVPAEALGRFELISGGFPATYGDRMGGVLAMTTREAPARPRGRLTLSLLEAGLAGAGRFADGKGQWLGSGRRSLLDAWEKALVGEETPRYRDLFARLGYQATPRQSLSLRWLAAEDRLELDDSTRERREAIDTHYTSSYAWAGHEAVASERLFFDTTLSVTRVERNRRGLLTDSLRTAQAVDRRGLDVAGFGHEGRWARGAGGLLHWGVLWRDLETGYDYFHQIAGPVGLQQAEESRVEFRQRLGGQQVGLFVTHQQRFARALTVELGVRFDDNEILDEHYWSPRLNLALAVGRRGVLRAAWGHFFQSQRANELQVEDGESRFFPSERSIQALLGYEHAFDNGVRLRASVHRSRISRPRPRYENLIDPVARFPEIEPDRVRIAPDRAASDSLELLVRRAGSRSSWWASYVWSSAEDRLDGRWTKRAIDQPHALLAHLEQQLGDGWSLGLTGTYHSGWPATPFSFERPDGTTSALPVFGPLYSERRGDYARLDLRVARRLAVGPRRSIRLYVDVLNAANRTNERGFELIPRSGLVPGYAVGERKGWLPRVAIAGFELDF